MIGSRGVQIAEIAFSFFLQSYLFRDFFFLFYIYIVTRQRWHIAKNSGGEKQSQITVECHAWCPHMMARKFKM